MTDSPHQADLDDLDPLYIVAAQRQRVPDDLFALLREHVMAECANPQRVNYDYSLAGRIHHGEQIHARGSLPPLIKAWLCLAGRRYVERMAGLNDAPINTDYKVDFVDSWIVLSRAGDYNPIHHHSDSIVGVINIQIPPQIAEPDGMDGKLTFVFGQNQVGNLDFLGPRAVCPVEGDMYLFPGWLQHTVYPFEGGGDRITYAFNLKVDGLREDR